MLPRPRGNARSLRLFAYPGLLCLDAARFDRNAFAAFWKDLLYVLWAWQKNKLRATRD